ncbi:MAG: zinc dependent phospholipase C family protein [Oscillospiraceae bacterium]|jgi:hypothetical protein|nr:zinc dependent phospholipase C family protein [Oscillospiraceae bacterium]
MASWIVHLRVADAVSDALPYLSPVHWLVGNIAPDSGVTADDGTYAPPKTISHWYGKRDGQNYHRCADFYREQVAPTRESEARSFCLGYWCHLVTDQLWAKRIHRPQIARYGGEFADKAELMRALKSEWYGQDALFLRQNPDFRAWRLFRSIKRFPNTYLDYFPPSAFEDRLAFIRDFYESPPDWFAREFVYLTQAEADAFVRETAKAVLRQLADNI